MTLSTPTDRVETTVTSIGSLNNAWFPGGVDLRWVDPDDALSTGVLEDGTPSPLPIPPLQGKDQMGSTLFIVDEEREGGPGPTGEADAREDDEEGSVDDEDEDVESIEEDELDLVPISPSISVPPSRSVSVEPHAYSDSASTIRPYPSSASVASLESEAEDVDTETDDEPEPLAPTRPPHSPLHIEPCDQGVEDTLLTGDLSESHQLAWGKSVWYGRVRPWDGLVGVLRVAYDRYDKPNAYMIYYGYVYGGDTWVGNWRYARGEGRLETRCCPALRVRLS
ncbi:hypothetical protein FA13DRAFT_1804625 [Coprinellus micaceus]|uniref:Uncharacterized protein n=1 Tax=Coprinellus micaceus TaxID=71717 RepID=A0A4Y7S5B5_COPMI|nr:hypothetical protein FA13DRAFT_1804625 [Coprinellus micaceus]